MSTAKYNGNLSLNTNSINHNAYSHTLNSHKTTCTIQNEEHVKTRTPKHRINYNQNMNRGYSPKMITDEDDDFELIVTNNIERNVKVVTKKDKIKNKITSS